MSLYSLETSLYRTDVHVLASLPSAKSAEALAEFGPYQARLAVTEEDRLAAYRLRYLVFNLELQEGLDTAHATGYDSDHYDAACDHLIIEHKGTGQIIGTYRMQSGTKARAYFGYYSEQEFDFTPYESLRSELLELGRACVHQEHRSAEVLNLLWRGIMRYALAHGIRYLIGCCSLNSQDEAEGLAVANGLRSCYSDPMWFTVPTEAYMFRSNIEVLESKAPPKLLRAYLAIGAKICSTPAIDRAFRTIDFLTMIDLHTIHPSVARRYL